MDLQDLVYVASIDFEFKGDPVILEVHVFMSNKFRGKTCSIAYLNGRSDKAICLGEVKESEEMAPKWFSSSDLPYDKVTQLKSLNSFKNHSLLYPLQMWPDDRLWVPAIFAGQKFNGYFLFDGLDTIVSHKMESKTALDLSNEKLVF